MPDDGITLTATEWTVTASEKIQTGDYENYNPFVSISGEIPMGAALDEDARREIKAKLLALHKDAQEIVQRAAENRIAATEYENWSVTHDPEDDE